MLNSNTCVQTRRNRRHAAFGVALLVGSSAPLQADSMGEKKALVTFDRPVEVPGKVLPPGSYMFKSVDNNELVQIFSADEKQLFATVVVVSGRSSLQNAEIDCFVQLTKTRADAPQEVEGFFLPGRSSATNLFTPQTTPARHRS